MAGPNVRSGPGWGVFVIVTTLLILAAYGGFAWVWQRMDQLERREDSLQAELRAARSGLAASELQLQEQAKQAERMNEDIESLSRAVADLGKSVETQAERTLDITALRDRVSPSVVNVMCGPTQGTGFTVAADGAPEGYPTAIITNFHVIAECSDPTDPKPWVQQGDARPATVLSKTDRPNDLAVLFVASTLQPLPLAEQFNVGDPVLAIGSPYGVSNTVTSGAITNILADFITTDAAVGPGNSGGPLVDRQGAVIGVVSAELERSEGQNIAVPISVACRAVLACS